MAESSGKNKADKAKHLKGHRFKKGESGNPKGRPKRIPQIADMLLKIGEEPSLVAKYSNFEYMLRQVYKHAQDGQQWAVNFIAERTEGKVKDEIEINKNQVAEITFL